MSKLEIDGDALAAVATRVRQVVADFNESASTAHSASANVGHDGVAHRVREFADSWDIRRGKLVAELTTIAEYCDAIAETFADIDAQTASELRAATSSSVSASSRATAV